jgi:hypothetical protein
MGLKSDKWIRKMCEQHKIDKEYNKVKDIQVEWDEE